MTPFEDTVVCLMGAATILLILAAAKWEKSRGVGFVMAAISVVFLIGYVGFAKGRGGPKSVSTETKRPKEAEILWMQGIKDVGVYAILKWQGASEVLLLPRGEDQGESRGSLPGGQGSEHYPDDHQPLWREGDTVI
jgi:hypothetical protein